MNLPYYSNKDIKDKANEFRLVNFEESIPVDVEKIIESKLCIKIFPIPRLMQIAAVDAFITSKWDVVYVDEFYYFNREKRFRFTLAHELGHFILHKETYEGFNIKSSEDYSNYLNNMSEESYRLFERQADKFASYLLVPRNILAKEIKKIIQEDKKYSIFKEETTQINYFTYSLFKKFNVSEQSMRISIENFFRNDSKEFNINL